MPVYPIETPVRMNGPSQRLALARVSAGFPSPAADDLEGEIDPISWVVRHPTSTFWWRVEEDCLWDAGIRDVDLIAVDRAGKRRVGIGPTKTLAKCANEVAKRNPILKGVLDLMDRSVTDWVLPRVPVGDIWGVGGRTKAKLALLGVHTAAELRDMPARQARELGLVVLERTVRELQGEPCIPLDEAPAPRKGMAVTRSAGAPMRDQDTVMSALAAHATRAAEKLRQYGLVAGTMTVFFHTSRFSAGRPQFSASRTVQLTPMTSDARDLVRVVRACVEACWPKQGGPYDFAKSGVMLDDLLAEADRPRTLFDMADAGRGRSPAVMAALDAVNAQFGKKTMVLGVEGTQQAWKMRAEHRSPRYTTRISDLPVVR